MNIKVVIPTTIIKMKITPFTLVLFAFVAFIGYGIYAEATKKAPQKQYRLACHQEQTTFEKLYHTEKYDSLLRAIKAGNISFDVKGIKSVHMPSQLFEFVNIEDFTTNLKQRFALLENNSSSKEYVNIVVEIYENDKHDPNKKSPKATLFAGYILFNYQMNNQNIYQIQIDFLDDKGTDIPKRIECAITSLITL